jgi:hypothetical protein
MKSNFTITMIMAFVILLASCTKDEFNEHDAVEAQKELLNLKYQHELDLETLKQKGATALQQLTNAAALEQLKLNDSLATRSAIAARKQDYSVIVVDAFANTPIADADVTVSSEGKIYATKTNAQGVASFTSLYLFPTSTFLISKTGYAATQVIQQNITLGTAKLWNTSELANEITGSLYIETDLTNVIPERVGANILVTASSIIPASTAGSYTVYFPAYTDATGTYSIKVPPAPNGYMLTFEQIAANQTLYVNATEDDAVPSFPSSMPRKTIIKTYFNVNSFNATVPIVGNYYYFKVTPDNAGKVLYIPGYSSTYGYNQVITSAVGNKFQVEKLNTNNYYYSNNYYVDFNTYTYAPNTKVDVEMVDITGTIIDTAPKLSAFAGSNGKLSYSYSPEGGSGYIHLKRDDAGNLVPSAKGVILKSVVYDAYSNLYSLNFSTPLNTTTNRFTSGSYLLLNKGDKKVVNFYYGSGDSRVKQVY